MWKILLLVPINAPRKSAERFEWKDSCRRWENNSTHRRTIVLCYSLHLDLTQSKQNKYTVVTTQNYPNRKDHLAKNASRNLICISSLCLAISTFLVHCDNLVHSRTSPIRLVSEHTILLYFKENVFGIFNVPFLDKIQVTQTRKFPSFRNFTFSLTLIFLFSTTFPFNWH